MTVLLAIGLASSCTPSSNQPPSDDYALAIDALRTLGGAKGIPRDKIFYQFQLDGVPSVRSGTSGVRGGYTHASETWHLRDGCRLVAIKHFYVGRDLQITPMKEGETFIASGPRRMVKEEYYSEPKLEPYFNTLILRDENGKLISMIELPRERPEEPVAMDKLPGAFQ